VTSVIKGTLKKTFIYNIVKFIRRRKEKKATRARNEKELLNWEASGKPIPPPHIVKQRIVKDYARRFSLETMIETGTYLGDMVDATRDVFTKSFSIELDEKLYQQAKQRFYRDKGISIIHGDSGEVLPDILAGIDEPCLFWLDGHYSGDITARGQVDTPIVEELNHILNHAVAGHVILIDDARCFVGENSYPTIDELKARILQRFPNWIFEAENDIIRIHQVSEGKS
jgi:hypothetical protein